MEVREACTEGGRVEAVGKRVSCGRETRWLVERRY
jgi:hypothetical protein